MPSRVAQDAIEDEDAEEATADAACSAGRVLLAMAQRVQALEADSSLDDNGPEDFEELELEAPQVGPAQLGCDDHWTWNRLDCSHEVRLLGTGYRKALFHPNWSSGTAGVRGTRVLNNGRYYWEVRLSHRIFGTAMMVGVGTQHARLHADRFVNLLGEDANGWGLSHKGLLWHDGRWTPYTKPFRENEPTKLGVLFDGVAGTLTYYKDGRCLGIAFRGLDQVREPLFPIVCSTAAKTEMTLTTMRRDFVNLQDRCRAVIVTRILQTAEQTGTSVGATRLPRKSSGDPISSPEERPPLEQLFLPPPLKRYLGEALQEATLLRAGESCARNQRYNFPEGHQC